MTVGFDLAAEGNRGVLLRAGWAAASAFPDRSHRREAVDAVIARRRPRSLCGSMGR